MFIKLTKISITPPTRNEPIYVRVSSITILKQTSTYDEKFIPNGKCTEVSIGDDRMHVNVLESPEEIMQKINEVS